MKGDQKIQQGRGATAQRQRPTIGVFLEYITSYDLALWSGIAEIAQKQNVNLISFMGRRLRDPEGFVAQNNVIYSLAHPQNVDGLIFFSAAITPYLTSPETTAFFQRYDSLPQVSIGKVIENVPSIMVNSQLGLQDLLAHLIRDHNYRQIAFITGPESHPDALERFQVYKDVLAQHQLPFNPELVVSGDFKADSGRKAMQILLDKNNLKIDAVFAANDHMAISAIKVLQQRGIDIPGAIAVVGFDDVKECRYNIPPLSTVRQPTIQVGRLAAEMILAQLKGETVPLQVVLPTEAVIRQSCGCLSQIVRQAEVQSTFFSPLPNQARVEFQLSPVQRQTILLEMEKALQISAINEGAPITLNQLLDVFLTDVRQETSNVFLTTLGRVLRETILAEKDFTFWQEVLSTMRRYLLPHLIAGPVLFRAENLWYQAQVLVGEMRGQAEAHHWLQITLQARVLARISQRLITTFNTGQLMDAIANMLPQLGIKSGYLSLYEPQTTIQGQAPPYASAGWHLMP